MKRALKILGIVLAVVVVVIAVIALTPVTDPSLRAQPHPLANYDEAASRISTVQLDEVGQDLIPEASSIALLTGSRTETAVVIFHGYTSAPRQFQLIAQGYRAQGMNVWVPRLPYHGERDRLTNDLSKLSATGLRDFVDEQIDIASGLGQHVIVIGLSGGGSLAAWAGFERPEVTQTVLVSPLLHPLGYAEWVDRPLVRLLRVLPFDVYSWWDPVKRDDVVSGYSYPRYSLKGIAALLSLAQYVDTQAMHAPRPDFKLLLIRNDGDQRLDSGYNERYAKRVAGEGLTVFRIPASAGLLHNFISPESFGESHAHIAEAYRYLEEALGIPLPDPTTVKE